MTFSLTKKRLEPKFTFSLHSCSNQQHSYKTSQACSLNPWLDLSDQTVLQSTANDVYMYVLFHSLSPQTFHQPTKRPWGKEGDMKTALKKLRICYRSHICLPNYFNMK